MRLLELLLLFVCVLLSTYFFASGFLLTRDESTQTNRLVKRPALFERVVVVVIDALRWDFVRRHENNDAIWANKFSVLHDLQTRRPRNVFMAPFWSDPPTTTAQRLKGLTTGSLPTFIDVSKNFASDRINEDNWVDAADAFGKRMVFMGDDTWLSLFGGRQFVESHPFPSFNVRDLHTVDNGVIQHLLPTVRQRHDKNYHLIIAHLLGVDHVGHTFGPDHESMRSKLLQMNALLEELLHEVENDNSTLVVVMGDHGMTSDGNHGGASDLELESSLFLYSAGLNVQDFAQARVIPQIDFVPTMSFALGLPLPYGNLGKVIPALFRTSDSYEMALRENVEQVHQYVMHYASTHEGFLRRDDITKLHALFMTEPKSAAIMTQYLEVAASVCREAWATFDLGSMTLGLVGFALVCLTGASNVSLSATRVAFGSSVLLTVVVVVILVVSGFETHRFRDLIGAGLMVGPLLAHADLTFKGIVMSALRFGPSVASLSVVLHGVSLFSNSFIEAEQQVNQYLLATMLFVGLARTSRVEDARRWWWFVAALVGISINVSMLGSLLLSSCLCVYHIWLSDGQSRSTFRQRVVLSVMYAVVLGSFASSGRRDAFAFVPQLVYLFCFVSFVVFRNAKDALCLLVLVLYGPEHAYRVCIFFFILMQGNHVSSRGVFSVFACRWFFYASGRKCSFSSIDFAAGFVGFSNPPHWVSGTLIVLHTLAPYICAPFFSENNDDAFVAALVSTLDCWLTSMFVFGARRHLMVWRVFAPKFVFDACIMLATWTSTWMRRAMNISK